MRVLGLAAAALLLAACGDRAEPAQAVPAKAAPPPEADSPTAVADPWAGRWLGPEGLFLQIDPAGEGAYRLTLKDNLDTQASYDAQVQNGALAFERRGQPVLIRPGAGAQTGFKYLVDKTDCLILVAGQEGYCRG